MDSARSLALGPANNAAAAIRVVGSLCRAPAWKIHMELMVDDDNFICCLGLKGGGESVRFGGKILLAILCADARREE